MNLDYNVVGLDVGGWSTKVCGMKATGVFEVLTNQANFRQTPSVVALTKAERLMGESAVIKMKSNYRNSVRAPGRLLGLATRQHMLSEQLKHCYTPYKALQSTLMFKFEGCQNPELSSEQLLIALLSKSREIVQSHGINALFCYVSTAGYLTSPERKVLKMCAEVSGYSNVLLVDDWEALGVEYVYFRAEELQKLGEERVVCFVDFGYGKFSIHAVRVGWNSVELVDQEILRFTGSKNMDNLLMEFYEEMLEKDLGKLTQKALVKLEEQIQAQRKRLSANMEHHINIECIMGDEDLSYNLQREKMEMIVMPVLSEVAGSMHTLKMRVDPLARIDSVELVGGASRMPFFQEMVRDIFQLPPSKTLNASEALARGTTIGGALRSGILGRNIKVMKTSTLKIMSVFHELGKEESLGEEHKKYPAHNRELILDRGEVFPFQKNIKLPVSEIELCLYSTNSAASSLVGYYRFKSPSLHIMIDADFIIHVTLPNHKQFIAYQPSSLVHKKEHLLAEEQKMQHQDIQYHTMYELKNSYESLLYSMKESIQGEWRNFACAEERANMLEIVQECEEWLGENQNVSVEEMESRMEGIKLLKQQIQDRKAVYNKLNTFYGTFTKAFTTHKNKQQLKETQKQVQELFMLQKSDNWPGTYLTEQIMNKALLELHK